MKQVLVIGLGIFGMSLARELRARRVEVICVDRNEDLVKTAADELDAEAVVADGTDDEALGELHPERRDVSVCAIGEDSKESSILCTALLRQLGARRIVARAYDPLHARVLHAVGAHEVVDPERDFGRRYAQRLALEGVLDQVPLGQDLEISEVATPQSLVGKSLRELELPRRFGVYVVAVRSGAGAQEELRLPGPDMSIDRRDVLVLAARRGSVEAMLEKVR